MTIGYVASDSQWNILKQQLDIINDYASLKMTLPLGNRALKNVHTNQFLWCDLPHEFHLEYMDVISKVLQGSSTRHSFYEQGRWYISGVTINNDGSKFSMDLDLQPFATGLTEYRDAYHSYNKAYQDATKGNTSNNTNNNTNNNANANSNTNTNTTPKSTGNTTLKGGEGTFIDNLVKQICGNETDPLKKAKLIHEHIRSKQHYSSYSCSKYSTAEQCYKNITHLNCADMSRLTRAMMASAGLTCYVVHNNSGVGHFWVVIEIDGKKYASDNASSSSSGRAFDYFWNPSTGVTEKAVNGGKYYYNRGKNPSC